MPIFTWIDVTAISGHDWFCSPPFKGDCRGASATMQGDNAKPTGLVPLGGSPSLEDSLVPLERGTP